jgi:multidrug efflux pump subunit AcrB
MNTLLYRNPRLLFLVLSVIVALAVSALTKIGRQEDPTITNIFATIVTPYSGATPARVEALVTEKIEDELRELPEIAEINSVSRSGVSVITVELSKLLSDDAIEQTWSVIRDALADAHGVFPAGVPKPELDTDRVGAYTSISALVMRDGIGPNHAILRRYAEMLQDRLRQVADTKYVRLFGDRSEEIRVSLDPDRLSSLGLSFQQVADAVSRADAKIRAGDLRGERHDFLIELEGEIKDVQRLRAIPIGIDTNGSTISLGAVATIERGFTDPPTSLAYADGKPAVLIAARMEDDRQVDRWASAARAMIQDFERGLPNGVEHRLLFDQSHYTEDRFEVLARNMAIGVGLVVLVLLVSLGWRAAAVVAVIIPIATLLSLTVMQWFGLTIQQMSVTGLIVALGLLVDGAIVTSDEIKRRLEAGIVPVDAVGQSIERLAVPLLASTATTVLAFLPMALLPGPVGDFVGSIALSVIIMLVVSLVLALTVTPAFAGRLLNGSRDGRSGFLSSGIVMPRFSRAFSALISLALKHKGLAILGAIVLPVIGFSSFPTLTAQFFPGVDRDQLYIQVKLPDGGGIRGTEALVTRINRTIAATDGIRDVSWVVGESAPAFYYNMKMDRDREASFAEALVTTTSAGATERLLLDLPAVLDRAFPEARILVRGLVQGPPVDAPVELRLVGPDLRKLRALGDEIRRTMVEVPEIAHARADILGASPKLVFMLDEQKVTLVGLTLGEIANQLEASLSGIQGGSLVEDTEELPVRLRLGQRDRGDLDAPRSIMIVNPRAAAEEDAGVFPGIPLSALGTFKMVPSDSPIARRDGERINRVQGFVAHGVLPQEALKKVRAILDAGEFAPPAGFRLEEGDDAKKRAETAQDLAASAGLVVTLTLVTIFLTFGSYRLSLITGAVAILSMGLSVLALAIFQYPFGIQALIGTIGSIGVSVNAAIIMLTALQKDPQAVAGDQTAITRVVERSSRHILSTTITTVAGFVPLIVQGGGFWPPFAMAIAGGVFLSVVLAFFFTPAMFALLYAKGTKTAEITDVAGKPQPAPLVRLASAA